MILTPPPPRQPTWRQLPQQRQKFLMPGCECCQSPCSFCSGPTPSQITLDVAGGPTDAVCTNCEAWAGSFTLTNHTLSGLAGGACHWSSPYDAGLSPCPPGCSMCSRWHLVLTSSGWDLRADEGMMARYVLVAATPLDCMAPATLSILSGTVWCNNWPATVTITPV